MTLVVADGCLGPTYTECDVTKVTIKGNVVTLWGGEGLVLWRQ
jgi:hypothetical protein